MTDSSDKSTSESPVDERMREFGAYLQELRKKTGLSPQDKIQLNIQTSDEGEALIEQFKDEIKKELNYIIQKVE